MDKLQIIARMAPAIEEKIMFWQAVIYGAIFVCLFVCLVVSLFKQSEREGNIEATNRALREAKKLEEI